jgi:hypothetical protein
MVAVLLISLADVAKRRRNVMKIFHGPGSENMYLAWAGVGNTISVIIIII